LEAAGKGVLGFMIYKYQIGGGGMETVFQLQGPSVYPKMSTDEKLVALIMIGYLHCGCLLKTSKHQL
jgi:hypothetical protein